MAASEVSNNAMSMSVRPQNEGSSSSSARNQKTEQSFVDDSTAIQPSDKPKDQVLTQTRKLSKIAAIFNNYAIHFLIKLPSEVLYNSVSSMLSKRSPTKNPDAKNPAPEKSRQQSFTWLPQRKSKFDGNNGKSSLYQNDFFRQKAAIIERDASVSDAIAHCRLSLDATNTKKV